MQAHYYESLCYYTFDIFAPYQAALRHFLSTRQGGYSQAPYDSLNIGFGTADSPQNVLGNRQKLANALGIPLAYFCVPQQCHGTHIAIVEAADQGRGALEKESALPECDAMITKEKNICLTVLSADCVPLLFYDPVQQVIGACHAGWRGTVQLLAQKTALAMQNSYGCQVQDIRVAIGAAMGVVYYEVGEEVVLAVRQAFGSADAERLLPYWQESSKHHFDLHLANRLQLEAAGVPPQHIETAPFCTYEAGDLFFSARREAHLTGRFGAGIMLR
jgi:YfiH family protein